MDENFKKKIDPKFETGLISVIMPTYNRAYLITNALNSVLKQTYRPIEIIIVDDGSVDNTKKIVHDWKQNHEEKNKIWVKYIYKDNGGPSSARNLGIIESNGEFIQFLDSDDIIHERRFSKVISVMQSSSAEFVETGFEGFCHQCGEVYEKHYGHTKTDFITLLLVGRLWANTLRSTFRRSLLVKTGLWNEEMECFEDYEFVARALFLSKKNTAIRDILASARRGGGDRISDRLKTYVGRQNRIQCEKIICEGMQKYEDYFIKAKIKFVSRLYTLGIRSNFNGWNDLGNQCYEIATSLKTQLNVSCKIKMLLCRSGRIGALIYKRSVRLRSYSPFGVKVKHSQHYCKK